MASTAFDGTRCFETCRHSRWPGTAPSRENANIIRDADVTEAQRQKSCAVHTMISRNSAQRVLIDSCQM